MKNHFLWVTCAFIATACAHKSLLKTTGDHHPPIVHKMEMAIATDINSDDSATAKWAKDFMAKLDVNFTQYKPDFRIIKQLKKYKDSFTVKVIGGNWCSDTRLEIPRLCRVLYEIQLDMQHYDYFRVNRKKTSPDSDFATTMTVEKVPVIFIYTNKKLLGTIIEHPTYSIEKDLLYLLQHKPIVNKQPKPKQPK